MNWKKELYISPDEKPLDRLVEGYSNTAIFRTIGFIGDSLSSGEFESLSDEGKRGWHDYFEYSWGQYIARNNGLTGYNFSKGGMTAKGYMEGFAERMGYWSPELACQAYVMALGVNDVINSGMEIGSVADIDPEDYRNNKPTFIGYYAQIIARIKAEIQPEAKFFFVTMMNHEGSSTNEKRKLHADALYELAKYFDNSYVIDLFRYGPAYDDEYKEKFNLYHHLNPMGYIMTAKIIDSYIDYIIRHNPDDFRRVPFIGKNLK